MRLMTPYPYSERPHEHHSRDGQVARRVVRGIRIQRATHFREEFALQGAGARGLPCARQSYDYHAGSDRPDIGGDMLKPYRRGSTWWAKGRVEYNGRPVTGYIRESTGASDEAGARDWIAER